jgi:hypothetical protein
MEETCLHSDQNPTQKIQNLKVFEVVQGQTKTGRKQEETFPTRTQRSLSVEIVKWELGEV